MTFKKGERGNVVTMLMAGIAMSATLGFVTFSLLSGPIGTIKRLDSKLLSKNQLSSVARMALMDAVSYTTNNGDCDQDGFIEPRPGRDSGLGTPIEYIPYEIGAAVTDPWGSQYYYCVWDVGTLQDDATCGGPGAVRATGAPDPFTGIPASQMVLAVFSSGPDKTRNSSCSNFVDANTAVFTCAGDDICESYTYTQAGITAAGFWNLKPTEPTTAETGKKVEIGAAGNATIDTATGNAEFTGISTTGKTVADGGVLLANQTAVPDCNDPLHTGRLRYNTTIPGLEICDGTGWVEVGSGAGGGGGGGTSSLWTEAASNLYYDDNKVAAGNTSIPPLGGGGISDTNSPGIELHSFCASSASCDATLDFEKTDGTIAAPTDTAPAAGFDATELGSLSVKARHAGGYSPAMQIGSYWYDLGIGYASPIEIVSGSATTPVQRFRLANADMYGYSPSPALQISNTTAPASLNFFLEPLTIAGNDAGLMIDSNTSTTNANSAGILLYRSRGTAASPATLVSGDAIGGIATGAALDDGSAFSEGSYYYSGIYAVANGTINATRLDTDLVFYGANQSIGYPYPAAQEALRLKYNGNVGINYSNPTNNLMVNGIMRVTDTDRREIMMTSFSDYPGTAIYYSPTQHIFRMSAYPGYPGEYDGWNSLILAAASGAHNRNANYGVMFGIGVVEGNHSYALNMEANYDYDVPSVEADYSYCLMCTSGDRYTSYSETRVRSDYTVGSGHWTQTAPTAHHSIALTTRYTVETDVIRAPFSFVFGGHTQMAQAAENSFVFNLDFQTLVTMSQANTLAIMNGRVGVGGINTSYILYVNGTAGLSTGTTWTLVSDERLKDIHGPYDRGLREIAALDAVRYHYKKDNPLDLPSDKENTGFIAQDVQKYFPEAVHERQEDGYLDFDIGPVNVAMVNAIKELNTEQEKLLVEQKELSDEYTRLKERYAALKDEAERLAAADDASSPAIWYALLVPCVLLAGWGVMRRRQTPSAPDAG